MNIDDFAEFFALVNDGARPFEWQRSLVARIARDRSWPSAVSAPTGSGKSVVVEAHVFLAAWAARHGIRLPRRLSIVVGRRALVDSHQARAERILASLRGASEGLLRDVSDALMSLDPEASDPFTITTLRGAIAPQRGWVDEPAACQIICATPDMWGSRLLFGGYGTNWRATPREAGMLALDSVVVIDEAHLNRQLLFTARRVSQLALASRDALEVPQLQVVAMSATPAEASQDDPAGVDVDGLQTDARLAERLGPPKRVALISSESWRPKGKASASHVDVLCAEVEKLRAAHQGTIGCVVNRVDTAVRVAEKLRKSGISVELWVGRLRPMDADRLKTANPELFDSRLSPKMEVLVATQTIEVGVDLDLPAMVTELAPAVSLVQRAGRVNRRGTRPAGDFVVVMPGSDGAEDDGPPYLGADLRASSAWVTSFTSDPRGMNAAALLESPPPQTTPSRSQLMRPERHDVMRWTSTSTRWLVDEDLELWLRDDLEADAQAGLVLRGPLPDDDVTALELLRATPLDKDEAFPTSIGLLREIASGILEGEDLGSPRVFFSRRGVVDQLPDARMLIPGDVAIIDLGHAVTKEGVVVSPADAVAEKLETRWGPIGRTVVLPGSADADLLNLLKGLNDEDAVVAFHDATGSPDDIQVPAGLDPDEDLPWLVRTPPRLVLEDEDARQLQSASDRPQGLDDHQEHVAQEAVRLARACHLPDSLVSAEGIAGAHHDDGKAREEFQRERLGNRRPNRPVAKSYVLNAQNNRRRASTLPVGWRHEHLSVAIAELKIDEHEPERDLCLRLIGTSHGSGRGVPPHGSVDLVGANADPAVMAAAGRLFDEGGWNELLDATDATYGPWGCAYLEAILRAADCRVSKEGK